MRQKAIDVLKLKRFGSKGWYQSNTCECPVCNKSDKLGIKFTNKGGVAHCFRCSFKESLYKFLKRTNQQSLLQLTKEIEIVKDEIEIELKNDKEATPDEHRAIKKPLGYIPFKKEDSYLKQRYFNKYHYNIFKVGKSTLHPKLDKDYIIFLLYQNKELMGWLARSRKSKEWHNKNIELFKQGKDQLKLRYYNHSNIEFNKLLGGYDELNENTKTVVLVEGLFDKVGVDTKLGLNERDVMKCVCTFGNSVSDYQVNLLRQKNIDNIYLMYDYNTIEESKAAGLNLKGFQYVGVAEIKQKDKDPNDLTKKEIEQILLESKDFFNFYLNRININLK